MSQQENIQFEALFADLAEPAIYVGRLILRDSMHDRELSKLLCTNIAAKCQSAAGAVVVKVEKDEVYDWTNVDFASQALNEENALSNMSRGIFVGAQSTPGTDIDNLDLVAGHAVAQGQLEYDQEHDNEDLNFASPNYIIEDAVRIFEELRPAAD